MKLLNRLTIRNLKLNRKRTVVTIVGIMLSVALITAVASVFVSGVDSVIHYEKRINGDYHVVFYNVSKNGLKALKNNKNVESLCTVKNVGYAKLEKIDNPDKPYAIISAAAPGTMKKIAPMLEEGRLPENDREIVIPTHLRTNGGIKLKVGDSVTLEVGKRVLPDDTDTLLTQEDGYAEEKVEMLTDTKTQTYQVVGIMQRPSYGMEPYSAPGYTMITCDMENISAQSVDVYLRFTGKAMENPYPTAVSMLNFLNGLSGGFEINQSVVMLEADPFGSGAFGAFKYVILIVCSIIVLTSVFCIKNSFDISITEKIRQYGMLASIGATRKQIRKNVFYEAFLLGLIGIPLGLALGLGASFILMKVSDFFIGSRQEYIGGIELEFHFSFWAAIFSCLLGILTIFLSAFKSAWKASRISPILAIRNSGEIAIRRNSVRSSRIIKKFFGTGGDIAYKNMKRNRKKYRTTVISITVSAMVFIAMSSFMGLIYQVLKSEYSTYEYHLEMWVNIPENEEMDANLMREIMSQDYIDKCSVICERYLRLENPVYNKEYEKKKFELGEYSFLDGYENMTEEERYEMVLKEFQDTDYLEIYAVGEAAYRQYVASLGLPYEKAEDGLILVNQYEEQIWEPETRKMKEIRGEKYRYHEGETLSLVSEETKEDENGDYITDPEKDIRITGKLACVTKKAPFGLADRYESYVVVSEKWMDELTELLDGRQRDDQIKFYFTSDHASALQDNLKSLMSEQVFDYRINNVEEEVKAVQNLYTLVSIFLYGFILVISLIGVTNVFNTITTGMELRKQEFAMLKSIGMTSGEFTRMIRLESIFIGVKSLFFGTVIGLILSYVIYDEMAITLTYKPPLKAVGIAAVAVFVLIAVIMRYSMSKINKQNIIETIRNENI